jgi:serine/threonine-protein kinase
MATVYLAEDLKHSRSVALKVLHPELAQAMGLERFLREIATTANLQHPHIVPLHDSGIVGNTAFYVMPYVEGESLRSRLAREKQLPIDDAVRVAREVALALDYAHRRGVVHRDVKPENILLHEGQALVADFGIALAATRSGAERLTGSGVSMGTPEYMSPEQATGDQVLDARSDVYALGCVLFESLTGEPPFSGPTIQAIVAKVLTDEPRLPTELRRTIPERLEEAILTALAKLPADRYGTAAAFADALLDPEIATGIPSGRGVSASRRSRRPLRRARWIMPAVGLVAAAGIGTVLWLGRPSGSPPVVRQRIELWDQPAPRGTVGRRLAISPDGLTLAYADVDPGRPIRIKDRSRLESVPIPGTEGARTLAFSPDGAWLAFIANGRLKKVRRDGGAVTSLADSASTSAPSVAWLEGGRIAFTNVGWHLEIVPEDGGPVTRVFSALGTPAIGVTGITPLAGGREVLFIGCPAGCSQSSLYHLNLESRATRRLSQGVIGAWHMASGQLVTARRDGSVYVSPFAAGSDTTLAEGVPVLEGVRTASTSADMALSPLGFLVYVPGNSGGRDSSELVWVARDGKVTRVDSVPPFIPSGNWGVALSPDGRRVAWSVRSGAGEDIWIKGFNGGPLTRLTFDGSNVNPEWTGDGASILYLSGPLGGQLGLRARNADGSGTERRVLDLGQSIFEVRRVPGSGRVVVRSGGGEGGRLLVVTPGSASQPFSPLPPTPFREFNPAVSPDGKLLAYVSDETGREEVYVTPLNETAGSRWQISRSGGIEPVWASSVGELFYRDGSGNLVAASVSTRGAFTLGDERRLFPAGGFGFGYFHQGYDVTPDGRSFIFIRRIPGRGAPSTVVLVENWLTELRAVNARP